MPERQREEKMRQRTGIRKPGMLVGMLLAALLYRAAVLAGAPVSEMAEIAVILLDGQKLNAAEAREIQEQELTADEPLELNCWGEAGTAAAESPGNGQRAEVSLIYAGEKTELIIPGTEILAWEENGCFLDKETADALFGSVQAAGQIIRCRDREYTVCGTFESFRRLMLCRARKEDGAVLTAISCRISGTSGAASCVQEFMMRRSLAGKLIDFTFLAYLSHDLLLLLPVCLGIRLLQMISAAIAHEGTCGGQAGKEKGPLLPSDTEEDPAWREQTDRKRSRFQIPGVSAEQGTKARLFLCCLWLFLAAGILLFLGMNIRIPSDMIPSKWSDFSFWGTWWETQRENLLCMIRMEQGEMQTRLLWDFCRSVCADAGAVISMLLFMY